MQYLFIDSSLNHLRLISIISAGRLLLTCLREIAHAFQIADDTCDVIYVLAVAVRTFLQIAFVYVSAVITYRVRNIEREIIAALDSGNLQQMTVLRFRQVLVQIHVQSRATGQMLNVWRACSLNLSIIFRLSSSTT